MQDSRNMWLKWESDAVTWIKNKLCEMGVKLNWKNWVRLNWKSWVKSNQNQGAAWKCQSRWRRLCRWNCALLDGFMMPQNFSQKLWYQRRFFWHRCRCRYIFRVCVRIGFHIMGPRGVSEWVIVFWMVDEWGFWVTWYRIDLSNCLSVHTYILFLD